MTMQAKLIARLAANQHTISEGSRRIEYICYDSIAALTTSQDLAMDSNLILECHGTLNGLDKERTVEPFQIPGYKVIRGNGINNDFAKLGVTKRLISP